MKSAPATDNVMIKIWKFTEFTKKTESHRKCQKIFSEGDSYNIHHGKNI